MSDFTKLLKTRIGTCRSGTKFDIPHKFADSSILEFWTRFSLDDRVDLFCMTEAKIALVVRSSSGDESDQSLDELNNFIWTTEGKGIEEIRPRLEQLGLFTSPAYVQFGQKMLLR